MERLGKMAERHSKPRWCRKRDLVSSIARPGVYRTIYKAEWQAVRLEQSRQTLSVWGLRNQISLVGPVAARFGRGFYFLAESSMFPGIQPEPGGRRQRKRAGEDGSLMFGSIHT
jgi:hypothetical protein